MFSSITQTSRHQGDGSEKSEVGCELFNRDNNFRDLRTVRIPYTRVH